MGGQNLIESEERCADASRLQPRVAERGTSILLMARPTGVSDPGLQPITSHPPSLKLRRGRLITNHPGIRG
jgi:hypothetical protein